MPLLSLPASVEPEPPDPEPPDPEPPDPEPDPSDPPEPAEAPPLPDPPPPSAPPAWGDAPPPFSAVPGRWSSAFTSPGACGFSLHFDRTRAMACERPWSPWARAAIAWAHA
ncbi:MAG: hypothetical protein E6G61_07430 [Actinobacteria bacterium]|nr:MAG: hypothetical protein E6G61_07430 [Actinomycetota bacterium]